MRSSQSTASEFNPENSSESKEHNASLVEENLSLKLQNKNLISENKVLRDRIKKLEEKNRELEINLHLSRQFNPNLNTSGFFSFNFPPKPAELLSEELSLDYIRDELLPWICEEVGKLEEPLKIIRSEFKSHLDVHESHKIILKGKMYSREKMAIIPISINAVGDQTEEYFTRENCIKITDHLFNHFQLKTNLKRISDDHKKYRVWIPNQALLELNELRKKSKNTFNNPVSIQSDNTKNQDQSPVSTQTMKM